ncbi:MAG: rhamnulokinase [Fimbriimonadaceae bacterium]
MKRPFGAIAVDLGATSGRFAAGWLEDGRIVSRVVEQIPNSGIERHGHTIWDLDALLALCRSAIQYGQANFVESYLGIDSWGVDQGFLDLRGNITQPPVCYRDPSHKQQFENLKLHRPRIFALTGIAHQPFNTIYQLAARRYENPNLVGAQWLNIPDLLGRLLGGPTNMELTMASTTQLMGLDRQWCDELFKLVGWPVPDTPPTLPGRVATSLAPSVHLAHVGSHDTASAIYGLGPLPKNAMYLNLGTWSLAGVLLDEPIATPAAEAAGFTNERAIDGRVRFLKNIPGFYVLNRLHEDLAISVSVPEWIESADEVAERIDLLHADLYNPPSMLHEVMKMCGWEQATEAAWAGLAVHSLTATIAAQVPPLRQITGRPIDTIRVSGGGSRSEVLCRSLARASGCDVVAGPVEATVVGNLAMSLLARATRTVGTDGYSDDLATALVHAGHMSDYVVGSSARGPATERRNLSAATLDAIGASGDLRTFAAGGTE